MLLKVVTYTSGSHPDQNQSSNNTVLRRLAVLAGLKKIVFLPLNDPQKVTCSSCEILFHLAASLRGHTVQERAKRGTVEFAPAAAAAARTVAAVGSRQVDARTLTQAAVRTSVLLSGQGPSKRSKWDHGSR